MKNYGYMRVSTDKQDSENQRGAILEFANKHGLGQIEFFGETISSRKTDRAIFQLIEKLAPDDNLVIFELCPASTILAGLTTIILAGFS